MTRPTVSSVFLDGTETARHRPLAGKIITGMSAFCWRHVDARLTRRDAEGARRDDDMSQTAQDRRHSTIRNVADVAIEIGLHPCPHDATITDRRDIAPSPTNILSW